MSLSLLKCSGEESPSTCGITFSEVCLKFLSYDSQSGRLISLVGRCRGGGLSFWGGWAPKNKLIGLNHAGSASGGGVPKSSWELRLESLSAGDR